MPDVITVIFTVVAFGLSLLYVSGCDRLKGTRS